jgi:UDP-N-acetylmuramoyl-L-alanyl-D-glutamate--2,6-diaminopimelate ligase
MHWTDLISEVTHLAQAGIANPVITGVEYDSRRVGPGSVFVAMRGGTTDGNRFVAKAIELGASGILTDSSDTFAELAAAHLEIPRLLVGHGRNALAQASAAFYGHPERRIKSTGVTGTNGKTTTAFLIEALLNAAHRSTILVGTIEYHVAGETRPSAHTTPESRDLFELMADGAARGATELVMEVSSHALDQGRVAEVGYDVAVFTNLTRDHLDYHETMEKYFASKRLLFDGLHYPASRVAVLNADDEYFAALALASAQAKSENGEESGSHLVTYALQTRADWCAKDLRLTPAGAEFMLCTPESKVTVQSNLAGEVNVLNLLAALAAAHARGVPIAALIAAIPLLKPVPGRFQPVNAGQPFTVIVDYAHTDDALRNLTALARQILANAASSEVANAPGGASERYSSTETSRVITLFGCGGDRDRTKRPKMGLAAGQGSDFVIVTSDNPRSEDPDSIIAEILPGVTVTGTAFRVEPDRAKAIQLAIQQANLGDIVLIAGKGHEKEQILSTGSIFFDDMQVALAVLNTLGYGARP